MAVQMQSRNLVTRQYRVTHRATGEIWLANYTAASSLERGSYESEGAARVVGMRWPADCDVHVVRRGKELQLPFDEIPLRIGKPQTRSAA